MRRSVGLFAMLAFLVVFTACTDATEPAPTPTAEASATETTLNGESRERQPDDLLLTLGTQTRVGDVRIGVMTATERENGMVARLRIAEDDGESEKVVVSPGEEFSLFSEGKALLVDVLPDGGQGGSSAVLIRLLD